MAALVMLATVSLSAGPGDLRTDVRLSWLYPTAIISEAGVEGVDEFIVYSCDTLPTGTDLQNPSPNPAWKEVARIGATPAWQATVPNRFGIVLTGQTAAVRFYVVTAKNYWGESPFSNVWGTPAPPTRPTSPSLVR